MSCHRPSRVRSAALRSAALNLAKACSMGLSSRRFDSTNPVGRHRLRPRSQRAVRTPTGAASRRAGVDRLVGARSGEHIGTRVAQAQRVISSRYGSKPASEVIAEPRSYSTSRRPKSSLRAPYPLHPSGSRFPPHSRPLLHLGHAS
jgi:hypothetical protein